jgi:hypothetical protein
LDQPCSREEKKKSFDLRMKEKEEEKERRSDTWGLHHKIIYTCN